MLTSAGAQTPRVPEAWGACAPADVGEGKADCPGKEEHNQKKRRSLALVVVMIVVVVMVVVSFAQKEKNQNQNVEK